MPAGPTCLSLRRVLELGTAQCMEGRCLARRRCALAKSNYAGLRFREPVYRTLRELAISYFEHYFNLSGQKTLRRYSRPVNLKRFDRIGWMTSQVDVWAIPEYLVEIPHTPILTTEQERALSRMDQRLMAAGQVGTVK